MSTITCAISKLPILPGEEIVCFPLRFSNTYQVKKGNGAIETKGMSVYAYDSFKTLALIIKGVAGKDTIFSDIYKNGNTESLEAYYGLSIEKIVDVLVQKENLDAITATLNNQELKNGIAIFMKRSIFDYIVKSDVTDGWDGSVVPVFEKHYDDLQQVIEEWNLVKDTMNELEQYRSESNPFGRFSEHRYRIFSDNLLDYGLKDMYETALTNNKLRDSFVETFTFVTRCNSVMGYEFLPTLMGNESDAIHKKLAQVTHEVLSKNLKQIEEEEEEWG